MSESKRQTNAFSIDVEDYFHVKAVEGSIARDSWDDLPCRVEMNTDCILAMLDEYAVKATFFTLGWVAERYPACIRRIAGAGHEIASHGMDHRAVTTLSPVEFAADAERSRKLLQDLSGQPISGYRAPSFSIDESNPWAFDVLAAAGYQYSSSTYPIAHDHYGMRSSPRFPYRVRDTELLEIPLTTVMVGGRKLPAGGGGYFRLLPYGWSRWAINKVNRDDGQPSMFFFHPWEIDPQQPKVSGLNFKSRFRHYVNLNRMESKLRRLLGDFSWGRVDQVFAPADRSTAIADSNEHPVSGPSLAVSAK